MASQTVVGIGFVGILIMWASVLGSVKRRERYAYGLGVLLILVGLTFLSGSAGGFVALAGFVAIAASTVPLLRE